MTDMDPQLRMSHQIDRNTERLDSHAALIADLAARMHITENQAERLWEQLGKMEAHAASRHSETMDAIHELKTDGAVLSSRVEMRSKLAGKLIAGAGLIVGAAWAAWQLGAALISYIKGVGS